MLSAFGVERAARRRHASRLQAGSTLHRRRASQVPADFSSAAFFIVAGCLAAERRRSCSRNVGVNPTRTGLLDLLRRMGADIRVHARGRRRGRGRRAGRRHRGAPQPLARHQRPRVRWCRWRSMSSRCSSSPPPCAQRRDAGARRARAAGQGERSPGGDGRRAWACSGSSISCCPMACGSAAARRLRRRRASTAAATTASPWPSPSPALRARAPIEIHDVANVATSFPGFLRHRARGRLEVEPRLTDTELMMVRLSRRHHRRPERLGQGHHQPRGGAPGSAGTCSTAARSTAWWRSPGLDAAGCGPMMPRAPCRTRRAPCRSLSRRRADGSERVRLAGGDVTAEIRSRKRRAGGLAGGRLAGGPRALLERQRAFATAPRTGGRRARHGHRGLPRGATSRSS